MNVAKQPRTFISYSRKDKGFALELAKELRTAGYLVWLDQLDIPTGARWDDEVERALQESEIFLIILTPASISSENVKDEIGYAIDHGKRILPILMEECQVPLRLRRFQYVDFTKSEFNEGVKRAEQLLQSFINEQPASVEPIKPRLDVQKTPTKGSVATPSRPSQSKPVQRRSMLSAATTIGLITCLCGGGAIALFGSSLFRQTDNHPIESSHPSPSLIEVISTNTPISPALTSINPSTDTPPSTQVNTATAINPQPSATLPPTEIPPTAVVSWPTWHQTTATLIGDVAVASDGTVWVAGTNGTIWFSSNQGRDFTQLDATGFIRIAVAPNGTVWAVGDNSTLWKYDGNWAKTEASLIGDVAVASDGTIWVAGTNGTIWFSSNQGRDFTQLDATGFIRIAVAPNGTVWAVGDNGTLWKYDGNWTKTEASLIGDVAVAPDGTIWVAGTNGTIWYSSSEGRVFTQVDASNFVSVAAGSSAVWAVGSNGSLWYYQ
jgi:photosystem II stability/assembly factor-like uncharacterized protein